MCPQFLKSVAPSNHGPRFGLLNLALISLVQRVCKIREENKSQTSGETPGGLESDQSGRGDSTPSP